MENSKNNRLLVENLCVGYSGRPVVQNVNFTVQAGEILTLIGANGSGKSTLLKTITKQLSAISGLVVLDGKNLCDTGAKELATKMSVVLTERIDPELLTCREVVATGRYPYTDGFGRMTDEDNRVVDEVLRKVDADALSDRHFDTLSDGQRQRIMLARALCQQPDVMVLDEPTSYLDIRYKADFMKILRALADEGMTVILSLHEIELARKISDRILCVGEGENLRLGTPDEIFSGDTIEKLFGLEKGVYEEFFYNTKPLKKQLDGGTRKESVSAVEQASDAVAAASQKKTDDVKNRLSRIAKPLNSLGLLEEVLIRLGGVGALKQTYSPCVAVMCADNGVVAQGVTQTGSDVTAKVAANMTKGRSSVCLMAETVGVPVFPYDIGMNTDVCGVTSLKTMYGTNDFYTEPAMSRETAVNAVISGINTAVDLYNRGYDMIVTGEMGIGNTTTSAAVLSALTGAAPRTVTGRGAGLSDEALERKVKVIEHGIGLHRPDASDPIDVISKVGGLDIAGMAGLFIGGAYCGIPVIIDGFISGVAALAAYRLCKNSRDYMIASHMSKEPGAKLVFKELGLRPLMSMNMALGEGTGAVSVIPLIHMAASVYFGMPTFDMLDMEAYEDYGSKK